MITEKAALIDFAVESKRAQLGPAWVEFDPDEIPMYEDLFRRRCVGDWHLHPRQRDLEPSEQDRFAWGARSGEFKIPWASIIVGDNRSPYWPMRAWVTLFHGGRPRSCPATLIEED